MSPDRYAAAAQTLAVALGLDPARVPTDGLRIDEDGALIVTELEDPRRIVSDAYGAPAYATRTRRLRITVHELPTTTEVTGR